MRFLIDECTGPAVVRWLHEQGHDVFSTYEEARGAPDALLLNKALREDRILITNDKDFGESVYRDQHPHRGIILLRLEDERAHNKIEVLRRLLGSYADLLPGRFVVVTDTGIRFAQE
jgi:predicted nuclease of predicted toxin-antitoxin system